MSLKTIPASVGREVPIGSSGRESGLQWVENWREGVMGGPLESHLHEEEKRSHYRKQKRSLSVRS